jgi:predicted PurR-regulated permease PerM
LVVQQLENQVLVPLVMRRAVGVNPVIILVALLGGAQIAGIIGMLIAIPAVVFLQEVVDDWVQVKSRRSSGKLKV